MKSKENLFGAWAVFTGVIIAVILGIFQKTVLVSHKEWLFILLVFIGIIIGLVSIRADSKEASTFLIAIISLVIVSSMGQERLILIGDIGLLIVTILNSLLTMFIPATIIVALKTVFSVSRVS
ncbi:MAG: hypothetical protein WC533_00300 [Candidatus Pacearchaeota archaeon]